MRLTAELARFTAETPAAAVDGPVGERVKTHLLDAFACGFVGARWPWADMAAGLVAEQGGRAQASAFGHRRRRSLSQAALLNGIMISGFEADHSGHHAHSGATVTPAALAVAEHEHRSGRELLTALAVASEVGCRIGDAQTRAVEDERGFHNPGVNGPFAAAAAAGRLLGLDAEAQARAFGIAGSHSAGLVEFAWDGSMTKRLHLGRASQHGLESALLAARGFTGPPTVLEGPYGTLHAFSPAPRPELALAGLGERWLLAGTLIKPYPAHGACQNVITAVQALKRSHPVDPGAVRNVRVRSTDHRVVLPRFSDPAPVSHLGAQCSLPFTTAVALCRNLDDPLQYDATVLADPVVRKLARLVTFAQADTPDGRPLPEGAGGQLTIDVEVAGATLSATTGPHPGSIPNPASFAMVEDKFHRFSAHLLGPSARRRIVDGIRNLEQLPDAASLAGQIRC